MTIKEHFIQLCDAQSTTGEQLENLVMNLLKENQLKVEDIRGQGYEGAANMSGPYKGLQSRIQKQNEKPFSLPCSLLESCISGECKV